MKKILMLLALLTLGFGLGGCGSTTSTENKIEENIVTRTGTINTKSGDEYIMITSEGMVNVTSTKINLDTYMKKQIKVTGMFSGTTLYVDKLEEVK